MGNKYKAALLSAERGCFALIKTRRRSLDPCGGNVPVDPTLFHNRQAAEKIWPLGQEVLIDSF